MNEVKNLNHKYTEMFSFGSVFFVLVAILFVCVGLRLVVLVV